MQLRYIQEAINSKTTKNNLHLRKIKDIAKIALENIIVSAGHGLNYENVKNIIKIPEIHELNIGHFIIGEAIFYGLENVILKMLKLMKMKENDFRYWNRYMRCGRVAKTLERSTINSLLDASLV